MIKQTSPDKAGSDEAISQEINRADNKRSKEIFSDDEVISNKDSQEICSYGELSGNEVSVPQKTRQYSETSCDEVSVPQEIREYSKTSCDEVCDGICNYGGRPNRDEVSVPQKIRNQGETSCDEVLQTTAISSASRRYGEVSIENPREIRTYSQENSYGDVTLYSKMHTMGANFKL